IGWRDLSVSYHRCLGCLSGSLISKFSCLTTPIHQSIGNGVAGRIRLAGGSEGGSWSTNLQPSSIPKGIPLPLVKSPEICLSAATRRPANSSHAGETDGRRAVSRRRRRAAARQERREFAPASPRREDAITRRRFLLLPATPFRRRPAHRG